MKIIITTLLIFLYVLGAGQNEHVFKNDSLLIFSKLEKSKVYTDIEFGNKESGLYRKYRKLNGKWNLINISLWKDSDIVWTYSPGLNYSISSRIKFNNKTISDNSKIQIPYENGKIWLIITIHDRSVESIKSYKRSGEFNDEMKFFYNGFTEDTF